MKQNLIKSMPVDQIRLCSAKGTCIEARAENAKAIVSAVIFLILCIALYYFSKAD